MGIDGSDQSFNALKFAINYAKAIGLKEITTVSVRSEGWEKEAEKLLDKVASIGKKENIQVNTESWITDVNPAVDIVNYAELNGFTHIIVGHRGRTGIPRILLGSVAATVAERAHCKVTVVR